MIQQKRKRKSSKSWKIFLIILILLLFILILLFFLLSVTKEKSYVCGDNTLNEKCSLRKPYFCLNGTLLKRASVCGCSDLLTKKDELCISKYQINSKNISLRYILRGEEDEIDFVVYEGLVDYLLNLPKFIYYQEDEKPSRKDFKLKRINEKEQRELILPLVTEIQNIAKDKNDQARIAISIVQNIPYNESERNITLGFSQINYSRYSYEVLYDMQGACEGRSELLAFLLKEIGYGVALFYYPLENHEAVGIKCPVQYSLDNTGYCFVETTGPSIISDNQGYYLGWGKLSSIPEIILISEGDSLDKNLYEYQDAEDLIKINTIIETKGEINIFYKNRLDYLRKKYGLGNR